MRTFIDLKAALVRDKIDRALESLYLEAPRKEPPQHVVCYGVQQKAQSQLKATV